MKLSEYQAAALVTAQPRAFDLQYLVPMIVGEIGELFGQKAKSHWHGWEASKLRDELVSEYGDVAWGTAILLHVAKIDDIDPEKMRRSEDTEWQQLLSRAHYMHLFYSGSVQPYTLEWVAGEAQLLWLTLERHCSKVTGVPFETVLQANLKKLADRAARGVLQGQGDHR
jgi:NTP pyrophosphatase (non-canonical NTP hydrolase)